MKYREIADGIFVDRPNRFIAHVEMNGAVETVHVKNTGRCKELLLPGTAVRLEVSDNPKRKTKYDLVAVHKQGLGWVNMDSQAPNKVVGEWLAKQGYDYIKPEFTYGKSRIDFYMEKGEQKYLMEVKGCTLEVDGIGYFPDAPTERGVKHLHELAQAQQAGYRCAVAFVIQMEGITEVRPNVSTQPEFGTALAEAKAAGVRVLFLLDIRLLAVSLAALLALYLLRRRKGMALCRFGGRGPGFWAACGLGGLFVIVGGLAALDFDRAFTVFHTIFFPGKDNWLFDPMTDPVILILPEEFFRSCALLILAGLLLACGVLIAADLRRRRR